MSTASEIVLASLNVHGGRTAGGEPFDLAAAVRSLAAAVVALQETWHDGGPDPLAAIAAEHGARLLRAYLMSNTDLRTLKIADTTRRGQWGLALLTRFPVGRYEVITLGRAPGDIIPRAAQLVTLQLPGGQALRVVNAHLTHRFTSPVQLVRLVIRLTASDVPTVLAGDLNMPAPVTGLAAGFAPAVSGKTFPARRPLVQLDHILTGHHVRAHGGTVLPPVGSDHLPVRAGVLLADGS